MNQPDAPQVYVVEVLPDDDHDSRWEMGQVFDNRTAADEYAAGFVAPRQARVYPMPVLSSAPATVTVYRLTSSLPNGPASPMWGFTPVFFDPAAEEPDVEQVDATDPDFARLSQVAPVTVSVEPFEGANATVITVAGTDRSAVRAGFAQAYRQVQAEINAANPPQ